MSSFSGAYNEQFLTDASLAYLNEQTSFIARKVAPVVPVIKQSAQIVSYGADSIRLINTVRATGGGSNQVDLTMSAATHYTLEDHALHDYIPYEDYENAEFPVDPQVDITEHLTQLLMVAEEYSIATALQNTATYTNSNYVTLSGGSKWSDYANSDPLANIKTAVQSVRSKSMQKPNTLILAYDTMLALLYHPKVRDMLGVSVDMTFERLQIVIAKAFPHITNILIGEAQYNNADKGASLNIGDLWTDTAIVAYIEPKPRLKSRSLAFTYLKRDENMKVQIVKKNNNNQDLIDRNADFLRVNNKYDQVIVDNACAYLINNTL